MSLLPPRMLAAIAVAIAAVLGGAAVTTGAGCTRRDANEENAAVVDTELLAYLSEARAFHHQADLKKQSGDVAGAIAAMDRLVAARKPHANQTLPEVEEVLADAYARLAELHLERGELALAAEAAQKGLAHAPDVTYFRGHLVEVQGLVEEARAAELADAGKTGEAAAARTRAIQLLEDVVKIQDQVIQGSLGARDGGPEGAR